VCIIINKSSKAIYLAANTYFDDDDGDEQGNKYIYKKDRERERERNSTDTYTLTPHSLTSKSQYLSTFSKIP